MQYWKRVAFPMCGWQPHVQLPILTPLRPIPTPVVVPDDMHRHVHPAACWCLKAPDAMWPRWPQRYATSSALTWWPWHPRRDAASLLPRRSQRATRRIGPPMCCAHAHLGLLAPTYVRHHPCVVRHTYFFIYFIKLLPNCHKKLGCQNYFVPR